MNVKQVGRTYAVYSQRFVKILKEVKSVFVYQALEKATLDINECLEQTSGCEQLCSYTPWAFACQCFPGFSLKSDKTTCSKLDENPCENFNKTCEYTCDPTEQKCLCPIGYQLAEDGQSCIDVNECAVKPSPCLQECTNTNGSFQCYCRPGYTLDKDEV